ncbi:MAG: hypothetical protein ACLP9S_18525 [Syntrophales bacterium]
MGRGSDSSGTDSMTCTPLITEFENSEHEHAAEDAYRPAMVIDYEPHKPDRVEIG